MCVLGEGTIRFCGVNAPLKEGTLTLAEMFPLLTRYRSLIRRFAIAFMCLHNTHMCTCVRVHVVV